MNWSNHFCYQSIDEGKNSKLKTSAVNTSHQNTLQKKVKGKKSSHLLALDWSSNPCFTPNWNEIRRWVKVSFYESGSDFPRFARFYLTKYM
jgi:hypothetical protein